MCMARANIYLPDDLYKRVKVSELNVSEVCRRALERELANDRRMRAYDEWLDEARVELGPTTPDEEAAGEAWAEELWAALDRVGKEKALRAPALDDKSK